MANDLDQSVSNAIAGGVSAPIDLIAWALRKAGVPGVEKPVLGSDWMREKGLTVEVPQGAAQIGGETVGNLLDPLGALGGASKAMLIGTHLPDAGVTKLLDILRKGGSDKEGWLATGREIVPTESSRVRRAPNALDDPYGLSFVKEISDKNYKANPNMLYTPTEKEALVQALDPIRQASARIRAQNTELFLPGRHRLGDLIEHPELFAERPDLKDLRVHVDPKERAFGSYNPSARSITLATTPFLENPAKGHLSTIMHELTHDQQRVFGMPRGANVPSVTMTGPERDALFRLYEFKNANYSGKNSADYADLINTYNLAKNRTMPFKIYQNILGEQQARAVQRRLHLTDAERSLIPPTESYSDLESGLNPSAVRALIKQLREVSPTP